GKMLHEIKSLVTEEAKPWLDVISTWTNLCGCEGKEDVFQENRLPLKRKSKEETNIATKRQKAEQLRESEECQAEDGESYMVPERKSDQNCGTESQASLEISKEEPVANEEFGFSFRVSCCCSGAIAKILTSQRVSSEVVFLKNLRMPFMEEPPPRACRQKAACFRHPPWCRLYGDLGKDSLPLASCFFISMLGLWKLLSALMLGGLKPSVEALSSSAGSVFSRLCIKCGLVEPQVGLLFFCCSFSTQEDVKTCLYSAALPLPSEGFDAVIADIPFGKKFKITKDVQLLPDILQEMERYLVLCVGGTIVLLLSQDLHKRIDGIAKLAESDSPIVVSDGASEAAKALNVDGKASSSVNSVEEAFVSSRQTRFGPLVPHGVYGVSLRKTDAFIHKYGKISTAGNH
ncbi:THUM2 protein, partial [Ceuthmochares aereus]|nr:THUM2 protein [Ceuthmochares aereus]